MKLPNDPKLKHYGLVSNRFERVFWIGDFNYRIEKNKFTNSAQKANYLVYNSFKFFIFYFKSKCSRKINSLHLRQKIHSKELFKKD